MDSFAAGYYPAVETMWAMLARKIIRRRRAVVAYSSLSNSFARAKSASALALAPSCLWSRPRAR